MKVLVTGATGHLGSLVVEALLKTDSAKDLAVSVRNRRKRKRSVLKVLTFVTVISINRRRWRTLLLV